MNTWPSPAKLNLFLYITGRRPDNYHNLQTLFQFLDFGDELTFTHRNDNIINLLTSFVGVAHDDNLIIKAAKKLLAYCQSQHIPLPLNYGVDITINKKIPQGGGLGGGSSNAATTLVALNKLWQLNLSKQILMNLGKQLGADVPIFIFGHSAFAEGIGEQLTPVNPKEHWYLVIKPTVEITTVSVFSHPDLKRDSVTQTITQLLNKPFANDCEAIVKILYPQINTIITLLSAQRPTRLTGTGSCIFSECDSKQQAIELQCFLHDNISNIDSFVAKGCNSSPLLLK